MNNKKINWYRVEAVYYATYGVGNWLSSRPLRGVPKKSCEVLASSKNEALTVARLKHGFADYSILNTKKARKMKDSYRVGYMVSATKLKRPAINTNNQ